jgi:hypothetical protein
MDMGHSGLRLTALEDTNARLNKTMGYWSGGACVLTTWVSEGGTTTFRCLGKDFEDRCQPVDLSAVGLLPGAPSRWMSAGPDGPSDVVVLYTWDGSWTRLIEVPCNPPTQPDR